MRVALFSPFLLALLSMGESVQADPANLRRSMALLDFQTYAERASAGSSAALEPQEDLPEEQAAFRRLDLDGNGKVSKAEAAGNAHATLGFDRADRNKDGQLTMKEYESIRKRLERLERLRAAREAKKSASAGATTSSRRR